MKRLVIWVLVVVTSLSMIGCKKSQTSTPVENQATNLSETSKDEKRLDEVPVTVGEVDSNLSNEPESIQEALVPDSFSKVNPGRYLVDQQKDMEEKIVKQLIEVSLNSKDNESKCEALISLGGYGTMGLQNLITFLKIVPNENRDIVSRWQDSALVIAAANGVEKIGPDAKEAIPYLINTIIVWGEENVKIAAIKALGKMGAEAECAIPVILEARNDLKEGKNFKYVDEVVQAIRNDVRIVQGYNQSETNQAIKGISGTDISQTEPEEGG